MDHIPTETTPLVVKAVSPPQRKRATKATSTHWLLLFFACYSTLGGYYCMELPSAINLQLNERLGSSYENWQYQLNLLFAVATIPNIVVPIFSGLLVDVFSLRTLFTIFTALVVIGQAIFSIGVSYSNFPIMVFGRFVTGVGFGANDLVQCKITTDWFKSNFLAFALAMNLTFGRLGTAANFNITPMLLDKFGFDEAQACWFGLVVALTSGLAVLVTNYLDRPESRAAAGVALEGVIETVPDSDNFNVDHDKVSCSDFSRLGTMFFALLICVMALYGACQPFLHIASDLLQTKYFPNDPIRAGVLQSIPDILSAMLCPIFGLMVDRIGRRSRIIGLAGFCLCASHLIIAFTDVTPVIPLVMFGISYAAGTTALWPSVSLLVPADRLGTAIGVGESALNTSLTVVPIIVAALSTKGSFLKVELFFATLSAVTVIISAYMYIAGKKSGGAMEQTIFGEPVEDEER
ncbi:hypothetical protein K450DRAFT_241768 [Umbelopsis ramanniana AG]|uniref:Lysosomal dipeptide transporter MFSD1 n=1 Tax=Umbelopsis ramanniana AG TaxID=1314678 RepID=A0AAD5HE25_UMBRA|nr:uncharacterized protein K450DRAFT_241768 [Umbelopsis ramanniana AG]KAI8579599.1 hypothetical protein K450DRAFT_241768 [Umbelopsis ramanniana AG]